MHCISGDSQSGLSAFMLCVLPICHLFLSLHRFSHLPGASLEECSDPHTSRFIPRHSSATSSHFPHLRHHRHSNYLTDSLPRHGYGGVDRTGPRARVIGGSPPDSFRLSSLLSGSEGGGRDSEHAGANRQGDEVGHQGAVTASEAAGAVASKREGPEGRVSSGGAQADAVALSAPGALQSQHVLSEEEEEKEEEWTRWLQERALMLAQAQGVDPQADGDGREGSLTGRRTSTDGDVEAQRLLQSSRHIGIPTNGELQVDRYGRVGTLGGLATPLLTSSPASRAAVRASAPADPGRCGVEEGGQRQLCPSCHGLLPPADGLIEAPHVMANYCMCFSD